MHDADDGSIGVFISHIHIGIQTHKHTHTQSIYLSSGRASSPRRGLPPPEKETLPLPPQRPCNRSDTATITQCQKQAGKDQMCAV